MDTQPNPYAFITDPKKVQKKSVLPTGGSPKSRLMLVLGGVFGLIVLGAVLFAVIGSIGSAEKQEWLKLAQKQQELIRLSDIGMDKAQNRETKNLAVTTKLSLISSQTDINKLAKAKGADVTTKSLALGKDASVDKALTTATQTNQFDKVFSQVMKKELVEYQAMLKKLYDGTDSKKTKSGLSSAFTSAGILATEANRTVN